MVKILNTRQSDFKIKFDSLLKKREKDDENIDAPYFSNDIKHCTWPMLNNTDEKSEVREIGFIV